MCRVYRSAIEARETVRTVSVDEMTGIQALERIAPPLPMRPGQVERREFRGVTHEFFGADAVIREAGQAQAYVGQRLRTALAR